MALYRGLRQPQSKPCAMSVLARGRRQCAGSWLAAPRPRGGAQQHVQHAARGTRRHPSPCIEGCPVASVLVHSQSPELLSILDRVIHVKTPHRTAGQQHTMAALDSELKVCSVSTLEIQDCCSAYEVATTKQHNSSVSTHSTLDRADLRLPCRARSALFCHTESALLCSIAVECCRRTVEATSHANIKGFANGSLAEIRRRCRRPFSSGYLGPSHHCHR